MADFKACLSKLHKDLNILQERESKYGGNAPLELINQISDYQVAIELTEQAIAGQLGEEQWREALQPLNVSLERPTNIFQIFVRALPTPFMAGVGAALLVILSLGILSLEPVRVTFFATATPTPTKLSGDFNIAIGQFQVTGQGDGLDDAEQLAQNFTNALQKVIEALVDEIGVFRVDILSPAETGLIAGETIEERAKQARALAEAREVDVVIYGTIAVDGLSAVIRPEFFVNIEDDDNDQFVAAAEATGLYRMGKELEASNVGDRIVRSEVSQILVNRFRAITFIIHGLAHFDRGSYDQAEIYFQQALAVGDWNTPDIIYVWLGNAALKQGRFAQAEAHYRQALETNDKYSRAYGGLAQALYFQVLAEAVQEGQPLDLTRLDEVINLYQQALKPELERPVLANVTTRVQFGLGQVYLLKADTLGQINPAQVDDIAENYELAFQGFEQVLRDYEAERNPRLTEIAAYAHANLGAIYYAYNHLDPAITEYKQALELLPPLAWSANIRAIYAGTIGDIYTELGQTAEAEAWYSQAVELAESDPELRQEFQEKLKRLP